MEMIITVAALVEPQSFLNYFTQFYLPVYYPSLMGTINSSVSSVNDFYDDSILMYLEQTHAAVFMYIK
jgi:hypothetical protein